MELTMEENVEDIAHWFQSMINKINQLLWCSLPSLWDVNFGEICQTWRAFSSSTLERLLWPACRRGSSRKRRQLNKNYSTEFSIDPDSSGPARGGESRLKYSRFFRSGNYHSHKDASPVIIANNIVCEGLNSMKCSGESDISWPPTVKAILCRRGLL